MDTKKLMSFIKISFIVYLVVLIYLLFGGSRGMWSDLSIVEYALLQMNLIPFKTIGEYITAIITDSMNLSIPLMNLCGNLFMFLPMGVYLPLFIKKIQDWKSYVLSMSVILFVIEIIQFVFKRGAFDIDDLILNLAGAVIGFVFWNTGFVQKRLGKVPVLVKQIVICDKIRYTMEMSVVWWIFKITKESWRKCQKNYYK